MKMIGTSLGDLPRLRDFKRRRVSSWDVTGGNFDWWDFQPGETRVLADLAGPGCIKHIWLTILSMEEHYARKLLLRLYWDGEEEPSVETPIGDF